MKTAVVYWSGTGNTEAMAQAVAEGMTSANALPRARQASSGGHALGNGPGHGLRIARAAPIYNSSFHFRKFLSF